MSSLSLTPLARRWLSIGLVASLMLFGFYYAGGWWRGEDTSLLILFRSGPGDRDYLPLARQFASGQFGEGYTSGLIGLGWVPFPCFSVLPHGLALRWFGPVGFAVADMLTPCVYLLVATRLLLCAGVRPLASVLVALFVTLQGFSALSQAITATVGYALRAVPFYLDFIQSWEFRFPRNFITEIYVLGALGNWCGLARNGVDRPPVWWITTAAWMAAVLQSDVYSFIALALAFAVTAALHAPSTDRALWRKLLPRIALLVGVGLLLSIPFLVQRLHARPDVLSRYGVFPLSRAEAGRLLGIAWHFFPLSFVVFTLILPWVLFLVTRTRALRDLFPGRLAVALTVLQAAGYVAMAALVVGSAQGVQLYHFRDTARTLLAWSTVLVLGFMLSALIAALRARPWVRLTGCGLTAIVILLLGIRAHHEAGQHLATAGNPRAFGRAPLPVAASYRADFAALIPELDRAAAAGAGVLATADVELFAWWTGLRGRESWLAHIFVSSQGDDVLLARLAAFARLNGLGPEEFVPWLLADGINDIHASWFSGDRYQATPLYTFAPLADYTPEERRAIGTTNPLDCWHLVVPASERQRLAAAYRTALAKPVPERPPALIALTREFPQLHPDPQRYRLSYENRTFQLYRLIE
jgi:hypothetical protein